jgi:hypothetical protein
MDFFQAQEFFNEMYPGKELTYEFDDTCHRTCEIIFTQGKPNLIHHIECNRLKVNISGESSKYVPISPHRMNTTWAAVKKYMGNQQDVFIHPQDIEDYKNAQTDLDKKSILSRLCEHSGLSEKQILENLK